MKTKNILFSEKKQKNKKKDLAKLAKQATQERLLKLSGNM